MSSLFDLESVVNSSVDYIDEARGPLSKEELSNERKAVISMAPNTKKSFLRSISFLSRIVPSLNRVNLSFEKGVNPNELSSPTKPVIYVANHASNLDSLLIGTQLFRNDLPFPIFAAGNNLFKSNSVKTLLNYGGAFELERSFPDDNGAYVTRLNSFLKASLNANTPILFFPEGTRSRKGSINTFQKGLLSMILDIYLSNLTQNQTIDDLTFVPLGITYTAVGEEASFLEDKNSRAVKSNIFKDFLKLSFGLKPVYLHVGTPVSAKEYILSRKKQLKVLRRVLASDYVPKIDASNEFFTVGKHKFSQIRRVLKSIKGKTEPAHLQDLVNLFEYHVPSQKHRKYFISDVFADDMLINLRETVPVLEDHVRDYVIVEIMKKKKHYAVPLRKWSKRVDQIMNSLDDFGYKIISSETSKETYLNSLKENDEIYRTYNQIHVRESARFEFYGSRITTLLKLKGKPGIKN